MAEMNYDVFTDALIGGFIGSSLAGLIAFIVAFALVFILIGIIFYVIKSLALMNIAKKLKVKNAWLAWIPIADFYILTQTAKQNGLLTLLFIGIIIPWIMGITWLIILGISIWLLWLTGERLKKPGALSLLALIPIIGFVIVLGIYAWKK